MRNVLVAIWMVFGEEVYIYLCIVNGQTGYRVVENGKVKCIGHYDQFKPLKECYNMKTLSIP